LLAQKKTKESEHMRFPFKFPNSAQHGQSSAQQDERIKHVHKLQQEIPTRWNDKELASDEEGSR